MGGEQHSLALTKTGLLYSWGSSKAGQLGHGAGQDEMKDSNSKNKKSDETVTFPKLISSFVDGKMHVLKVACGMNHCCAITCSSSEEILSDIMRMNNTDGVIDDLILSGSLSTKLYTWGYGEHGRLGNGMLRDGMGSSCKLPTLVRYFDEKNISVVDVCAGSSHTLALASNGAAFGWGNNEFGQVGVNQQYVTHDKDCGGAVVLKPSPITFNAIGDAKIKSVSCGYAHSSAITTNDRIFLWGWNEQGQLGLGDEISRYEPALLEIMNCVKSIEVSLGRAHTSIIVEQRPGHSVTR